MKSVLLKPTLLSLAVLTTAVSLGSCAPATSDFGVKIPAPSTSVTGSLATGDSSAKKPESRSPRYPIKAESIWTISGLDQNNNALRSKITLTAAPPRYRSGGDWYYDGDNGYINLYEVQQGTRFQVWDISNPERLVVCFIRQSYDNAQTSYEGVGLSGSQEEIDGLFAKLSTVYGGDCRVTRS
ncbi:hypothetical protein [Deinococcus marmoris]|uniref:hypothetical protein n=1 Tax=Deinococcus marmoris TaxID=249408 RepID=UPI0004955B46|nr:hypothetical protein [Deinococcus marmoris]